MVTHLIKYFAVICCITMIASLSFPSNATANWLLTYGITSKHELSQPSAVPKLANALKDPNPKIRLASINYLMRLGQSAKEAIPAITKIFEKDSDIKVRLFAADALGAIGGPTSDEALAPLVNGMADTNIYVRKRSLLILQRMLYRGPDFKEALQKMASSDPHGGMKKYASKLLMQIPTWEEKKSFAKNSSSDSPFQIENLPESSGTNRDAVAVIIGNQNYAAAGKGVSDVDYAQNDAETIYLYVTKTLGYREGNIIYIKDATQADFISTFGSQGNPKGKLYDWVKADQSDVFVYYSGHGAPDLTRGNSYLLPTNGDPMKVELNGYPLETLYANLGKIPAKNVTVVIDACFSGSSASGSIVKSASSITLRVSETVPTALPSATILTAAGTNEIASWDVESEHGLFTRHFLEGISGKADSNDFGNGDGNITVSELKKYLDEEVSYRARRLFGREQHPQISGNDEKVLAVLPAQ